MQKCRRRLLVTLLALSGIALGQPGAACPEFPADDRAHGGDTFTIGDWTLVAGAWLATCADGNALWIACSDEGDALVIRLLLGDLAAADYTVSFGDGGAVVVSADALVNADGSIRLRTPEVELLTVALADRDTLRVRVTPTAAKTAARDVVFATAGFAEALPWLGCGDADACPARSCGP
jgi:hypothetical protein